MRELVADRAESGEGRTARVTITQIWDGTRRSYDDVPLPIEGRGYDSLRDDYGRYYAIPTGGRLEIYAE